jgi:D-glycero-D-manno-heptose 1,7-bisphosphate phosphatase
LSIKDKNLTSSPAVFLDRDGVINNDVGYFTDPTKLVIPSETINGLIKLNNAGYILIIVTNQSGIARGLIEEKGVKSLHNILHAILREYHITVTGIIYCPHHPTEGNGVYTQKCKCRKPSPGMIIEASKKFNIDLKNSYLIGDRFSDIKAGINAGLKSSILIKSQHKISEEEKKCASLFCADVDKAADWILGLNN